MKRLCIYITYHKEHNIHPYIGAVLQALKTCCTKVYLVCNYDRINEGQEYVLPYVDGIFYRANIGYDSGAYKDALCDYLGWEEVYRYDEIVLSNDSFFGFFYPLADTFRLMEEQDCDFWGFTGQGPGSYSNPDYPFAAHIHSYFMTFKESVAKSAVFRKFWEGLVYPANFWEAVIKFELALNALLTQHGWKGKSYVDIYETELKENENPCYSMPYELIRDYKMPVMKKKNVLIRNIGFANMLRALTYLKQEGLYPTEWMYSYMENQFYIPEMGSGPCNSLEMFYHACSSVYIYGAGVCAKNFSLYFARKGWSCKGFIVTSGHGEGSGINAINMEEAEIDEDTGIIVSVVNPRMADEIAAHIGSRCGRERLFFISDCSAVRLPD